MYLILYITAGKGRVGRWVRFWTRSEYGHVAFGFGDRVLDPTIEATVLLPDAAYYATQPRIRCVFEIPTDREITVTAGENEVAYWRSIVRWLTGGRWPETTDCIAAAHQILAAAGHPAPRSVTTPQKLHNWLVLKGFKREEVERVSPRVVAGALGGGEGSIRTGDGQSTGGLGGGTGEAPACVQGGAGVVRG